jgi:hypothetical protein
LVLKSQHKKLFPKSPKGAKSINYHWKKVYFVEQTGQNLSSRIGAASLHRLHSYRSQFFLHVFKKTGLEGGRGHYHQHDLDFLSHLIVVNTTVVFRKLVRSSQVDFLNPNTTLFPKTPKGAKSINFH